MVKGVCLRCLSDLFVLSWARVRQVYLGSVSSVVFICGGWSVKYIIVLSFSSCFVTMVVCIVLRLVLFCNGV